MISPLSISVLVIILLSKKYVLKSLVYSTTWILTTFVVYLISAFAVGGSTSETNMSTVVRIILLALAAFMVYEAIADLIKFIKAKGEVSEPKIFKKIAKMSPLGLFGIGFLMCFLNDKNMLLSMGAGTKIASLSLPAGQVVTAGLLYILIGCWPIYVTMFAYFLLKDKMSNFMDTLSTWLMKYNDLISFVMFLIIGISLLSEAI